MQVSSGYASYLSLFLFGLFKFCRSNHAPALRDYRMERVRQTTGCPKVSLGSFSETQRSLIQTCSSRCSSNFSSRCRLRSRSIAGFKHLELIAQDGTL